MNEIDLTSLQSAVTKKKRERDDKAAVSELLGLSIRVL